MSTERQALVLVAHADDETLGCGGTIRKLLTGGWKVEVVILSDGVIATREETHTDNRAHAISACAVLGIGPPRILGFTDQRFDAIPIADLASAVSKLKLEPDLILTHVESDLNRDHRLVCEVAKIIGRPRRKPISLLGCEIPNTTFWNGAQFPANYYVDISNEIDAKVEAFSCYVNEIQPYPSPWSREGLKLLAQFHGMQSGFDFAEAFQVIRGYEGRLP